MPEIEYMELEMLLGDLKDGLRYGHLSEAVTALRILSRYVEGLVKEEERWQRTVKKIMEGRKK